MSFFNKNLRSRKFLASLLVIAFLISALVFNVLLPPKPAKALNATLPMQIVQWIMEKIWEVKDYATQNLQKYYDQVTSQIEQWTKFDILDQRALKESWNQTRKELLDDLVNNILDNIQDTGGGETAFVTDWDNYLGEQTDEYFQDFVNNDLSQAGICDTFGQEVRQEISAGNEPPYTTQAQCPSNYDSAALLAGTSQDFWADWLQMIRPAGNPFGSYIIATDKKIEREALGYTAEFGKLIANQGHQGNESTPGIIQSYAAQRASMMDLDYLLNSTDLNEYFGSVIDAFINRISKEGLANMKTSDYQPQGQPPQVILTQPEIDLVYVRTNYQVFQWIKDMAGLIVENLNNLLAQQKINLGLMEQIKSQQDAVLACGRGLDTPSIDAELAQIRADIAKYEAKVSQANNSTIPAFTQLLAAADAVIAADQIGDQTAVEAALQNFNNKLTPAISSLQTLIEETTETDPERLHIKAGDYSLQIVQKQTEYFDRLGDPRLSSRYDPDSLYVQRTIETQNASGICSSCNPEWNSCSDACLTACSRAGH